MTKGPLGVKARAFELPYHSIKNLTSPVERDNGVQTWFANVSARALLALNTDENLRTYIAEHSRSRRNQVHREIANTIVELPDRFINRNSGITITCGECRVDDTKRVASLFGASIINGAQTQGELARFFEGLEEAGDSDILVRVEIIAEPDPAQVVEIAIARNTATSVKSISQAGARGHLDELKERIEAGLPGETIAMSETDKDGISPQTVLQICRALMPQELEASPPRAANMPYKQGGKCLTDFSEWAANRSKAGEEYEGDRDRYKFTVDMAAEALIQYRLWECHEAWNGHRLHEFGKSADKPRGGRPVRRDDGRVVWVAPGLLFPIMSALSAFVVKTPSGWTIEKPELFDPSEMVDRTVKQFRGLGREVALMGRSENAYDALSIYTETIASVIRSSKR